MGVRTPPPEAPKPCCYLTAARVETAAALAHHAARTRGSGPVHLTHMVIDDFFPEPDRVRQAALSLDYPPAPKGALYPGRNSKQPLAIAGLDQQLSHILGS